MAAHSGITLQHPDSSPEKSINCIGLGLLPKARCEPSAVMPWSPEKKCGASNGIAGLVARLMQRPTRWCADRALEAGVVPETAVVGRDDACQPTAAALGGRQLTVPRPEAAPKGSGCGRASAPATRRSRTAGRR
jgi:hypothetical protein